MRVAAYDMLAYMHRLKESGVDETQAEAHAEAVHDAVRDGLRVLNFTGRTGARQQHGGRTWASRR